MYAFATTPVHGLGMTAAEFWASTPREFAARRKIFTDAREFTLQMYAGLQASLANGPLVRTDKQMWTPDMFLPGYTTAAKPAADQSWRAAKRQAMALAQRTPAERARLAESARDFAARQSRAAAAQASGATGAEVIAIMEGAH